MTKQELMSSLLAVVDKKLNDCAERWKTLDETANTERMALSVQRNLYDLAKTTIRFAGDKDEFPRPFIGQTTNLLKNEEFLRSVLQNAKGDEQSSLAVYLHNMLFWRQNFLLRYREDAVQATNPRKQFEAKLKMAIIEDLMYEYRIVFEEMGGRKDLMI